MKKLFMFASAVALLASCSKDLTEDLAPAKVTGKSTIYATYGTEATRSEATPDGNGYKLAWELGDAIGVFDAVVEDNTNEYFAFTGAEGEFKGDKGFLVGDGYVAYYPYAEDKKIEGGKITLSIPAEQKYRWNATDKAAGSFAQNVAPAVAYGEATEDDNLTLEFRPVATYMRVPIVGSGKVMKLELTIGDKGLAGDVEVAVEDIIENVAEIEPAAEEYTETTITLVCGKGEKGVELDMKNPTYFWFVIPGGLTLQDELLTITVNGTDELTRQLDYAEPRSTKYNGAMTMGQAVENGAAVPFEWIEGAAGSYLIESEEQFIEYAYAATYGKIDGAPKEMFEEDGTLKTAMLIKDLDMKDFKVDEFIRDYVKGGKLDEYKYTVFYEWYANSTEEDDTDDAIETIGGELAYGIVGNVNGGAAVISNLNVKSNGNGVFGRKDRRSITVKNITLENTTVIGGSIFVMNNPYQDTKEMDGIKVVGGELKAAEVAPAAEAEAANALFGALYTMNIDVIDYETLPTGVQNIANTLFVYTTSKAYDDADLSDAKYYNENASKVLFKQIIANSKGYTVTVANATQAKAVINAIDIEASKKNNSSWFSVVDREAAAATRAAEEVPAAVKTSYWTGFAPATWNEVNDQKKAANAVTAEALARFSLTGGTADLTNDIVLSHDKTWVADGANEGTITVKGNGKTISTFKVNEHGFFGKLNATIENLNVRNGFVVVADKKAQPYLFSKTGVATDVKATSVSYLKLAGAEVVDNVVAGFFYEADIETAGKTTGSFEPTVDPNGEFSDNKELDINGGDVKFAQYYAKVTVDLGHKAVYEVDATSTNVFGYLNCYVADDADHAASESTSIIFTKLTADQLPQAEELVRWDTSNQSIPSNHSVYFWTKDQYAPNKTTGNGARYDGITMSDATSAIAALESGDVKLGNDIETTASIKLNGNVLDGNNMTITNSVSGSGTGIVGPGEVKNVNVKGGWRAVGSDFSGKLTLTNCEFSEAAYALNATGANAELDINDCKFYGWVSWNVKTAKFTGCEFNEGTYFDYEKDEAAKKNHWNSPMAIYNSTTFTNCTFVKEMYWVLESRLKADAVITLKGCKMADGTVITKDNFAELFKDRIVLDSTQKAETIFKFE